MTFMEFVRKAVNDLAGNSANPDDIVKKIGKLPKNQAIVVTAYICDHLSGTAWYPRFLSAVERQAR